MIRHGLNQFKEHLDLKYDVKAWKKLSRTEKTWKKFKAHFTRAINENKNDTGTLKAIGIANAVKEQINENKENQQILAQKRQTRQMRRSTILKRCIQRY